MITGIILGCYAVAWLFTARVFYGRNRGEWVKDGHTTRTVAPGQVAAGAMALALVWPLMWCAALVMFRPPPTAAERAAENARLTKRIAQLEREAGIRP